MTWPRAIIAFFICLAIFNGFLVYLAVTSSKGLVEDSSYDKGLGYQSVIEQTNNAKEYTPELRISKISENKYLANLSYLTKSGQKVDFSNSKLNAILPSSKDRVLNIDLVNKDPQIAIAEFEMKESDLTKLWLIDLSTSINGNISRWKLKTSFSSLN